MEIRISSLNFSLTDSFSQQYQISLEDNFTQFQLPSKISTSFKTLNFKGNDMDSSIFNSKVQIIQKSIFNFHFIQFESDNTVIKMSCDFLQNVFLLLGQIDHKRK
jgi:hypothetical protein